MKHDAAIARRALTSLLLLGVSSCSVFQQKPALDVSPIESPLAAVLSRDDVYYQAAVRAISARDYGRALDYLQEARQKQPGDIRVLNAFGVVYDKLGRFDLSARYYDQAKQLDPASPIVAANQAYSALLQGQVNGSPAPSQVAIDSQAAPQIAPAEVTTLPVVQTKSPSPPAPEQTAAATPRPAAQPAAAGSPIALPESVAAVDAPLTQRSMPQIDPGAAVPRESVSLATPIARPPAPAATVAAVASHTEPVLRPVPYAAVSAAPPVISAAIEPPEMATPVIMPPPAATVPVPASHTEPAFRPIPYASVPAALPAVSAPIAPPEVIAALTPRRDQTVTPVPHAAAPAGLPAVLPPAESPVGPAPVMTPSAPPATTTVISESRVQIASALPSAPPVTVASVAPAVVISAPPAPAPSLSNALSADSNPAKTAPAAAPAAHLLIAPAPTTAARRTPLASAASSKPAVTAATRVRTASIVRSATPASVFVRIPFALTSIHASEAPQRPAAAASGRVAAAAKKPVLIGSPLVIVNASGQAGVSEPVRLHLASLRWTTPPSAMSESAVQAVTVIRYAPVNFFVAHALSRTLPFPSKLVACDSQCTGVRLILGRDFLRTRFVKTAAAVIKRS